MGNARTTGCREQKRVITDQLCYGCGSKEHKIQKRERRKMKEEEMRGIMEVYNTRNETMICFSTEEEAQLAISEINIYERWRAELYKPIRKSRELERDRETRY